MNHIISMAILGILAGSISGFWTRIIKSNMILGSFGSWLMKQENLIYKPKGCWYARLLSCIFCLAPWICLLFCLFYILEYHPWWLYCVIGVLGCLGVSNTMVEVIKALRDE